MSSRAGTSIPASLTPRALLTSILPASIPPGTHRGIPESTDQSPSILDQSDPGWDLPMPMLFNLHILLPKKELASSKLKSENGSRLGGRT